MEKILKDPIYGYIPIEKSIVNDIIDSPAFQRLRHIGQTSYTPLYSAALHNRFVHSIGVYHLGNIASKALIDSIPDSNESVKASAEKLKTTFVLACLLHDVGHSPFSHSGEQFYLKDNGSEKEPIYKKLIQDVGNTTFASDFEDSRKKKTLGKPHEVMSAYIGIKSFLQKIDDKDFFTRCIIGLLYNPKNVSDYEVQVKNAFIQLLNSSCIDVDKIDYLLRDAYVTGFDTISIDYNRLLSNVCLRKSEENSSLGYEEVKYELCFDKKAVSVLENVIYAHDAEAKWIQNHPVVLYETFIIQYAIKKVQMYYQENGIDVFSDDALMESGLNGSNGIFISLLCDDDFIYTMKNCLKDPLVNEYFNRRLRRHSVWKSEADFHLLFDKRESWTQMLKKRFDALSSFLTEADSPIINEQVVSQLDNKIKEIQKLEKISEEDKDKNLSRYNGIKDTVLKLNGIASELKLDFDFVILKAGKFRSGFSKTSLKNVLIDFNSFNKTAKLDDVTTLLKSDIGDSKDFYYLFYRRNEKSISPKLMVEALLRAFPDSI